MRCVRIFEKLVSEGDKPSMRTVVKDYAEENELNGESLYREMNDSYSIRNGCWKTDQ